MPASTRTVRSTILAVTAGLLVVGVLALPVTAAASDDDHPTLPPPPSYAGHLARAGSDIGNPGYHYAVAHTQVLSTQAQGLRVTMSVHHPRQVRGRLGQHSLGQIAVGQRVDGSYLEAGWRQHIGRPRLFVYWRPADGSDTCYDLGCGFQPKGPGLRPGSPVQPGAEMSVAFQHVGNRWWLKVNGRKSGYYPDRLWKGQFTGTDFAQLYGEVFTGEKQRVCADMGNGIYARKESAAYMKDARWLGGPRLRLQQASSVREAHNYTLQLTGRNSFRYGGPGQC